MSDAPIDRCFFLDACRPQSDRNIDKREDKMTKFDAVCVETSAACQCGRQKQ